MKDKELEIKFSKYIARKLASGWRLDFFEYNYQGYDGDPIEIKLEKDGMVLDYYTKLKRVMVGNRYITTMDIIERKNSNNIHDQESIILTFEPNIN